jgi:hypothetical protein
LGSKELDTVEKYGCEEPAELIESGVVRVVGVRGLYAGGVM